MKNISQLIVFSTLLLLFYSINPAEAHIEGDNMPDSVAEMEYRILLEFEPDNLEVRGKLGMVLYRSGKHNEAANEFNYVLDRDPENSNALVGLARVNIKLLNYQGAVTLLQKAMDLDPDNMHTYYLLGQALEMQGDISGAEEVYKNGLARQVPAQNKHATEERQLLVKALNDLQERK